MLNFNNMVFDYEPYPIGLASPAFDPGFYAEMIENFPPIELFETSERHGVKYFLSKKHNRQAYESFIAATPLWREFRSYLQSDEFVFKTLDMLLEHGIDLGMTRDNMRGSARLYQALKHVAKGHLPSVRPALTSRLEFSALPADGGHLYPHTDTPKKIITLVASITKEGDWDPAFGGGTEVMRPKNPEKSFNFENKQLGFDEVETIKTFEFKPNQVVLFVKTFNSLHGIRPMQGKGSNKLRRTLTINIAQDI